MPSDTMVPIAVILGRGEALTLAAMLDAAGIIVHVGGENFASTSSDILAMGGFRLTVPQWQHDDASNLVRAMLAEPEPPINYYMRGAIKRFALATIAASAFFWLPSTLLFGPSAILNVLPYSAMLLTLPVSPQGRGEYYLSPAD